MRTAIAVTLLLPAAVGAAVVHPGGPVGARPTRTPVVSPPPHAVAAAPTGAAPGSAAPVRGQRWAWPLSPRPVVARRFDRPAHRWSAGHRGVDLAAAVGQPVLTAGDGVVAFVGTVAGRGVVTVRHRGDWRTTYEPVTPAVAVGDVVRRGDRIGSVASTPGHCAPRTCLHWGALLGRDYRDPLALVLGRRVVLLPLG